MTLKPTSPCSKDCPDRYVAPHTNCHCTCERYKQYVEQNKQFLADLRLANHTNAYGFKHWYKSLDGWWRS